MSKFKPSKTAETIFGPVGKMISASKGRYSYDHPHHFVMFNANLCTRNMKLWFGDIDLTLDLALVHKLSFALGRTIYVMSESTARFDKEFSFDKNEFSVAVSPKGNVRLHKNLKKHVSVSDGFSITCDLKEPQSEYQGFECVSDDIEHKIKLEDLESFEPNNTNQDEIPHVKIIEFIKTKLNVPKDQLVDAFKVAVSPKLNKKIEDLTIKWARMSIAERYGAIHLYEEKKSMAWLLFEVGFYVGSNLGSEDTLYIRKGFVVEPDAVSVIETLTEFEKLWPFSDEQVDRKVLWELKQNDPELYIKLEAVDENQVLLSEEEIKQFKEGK